MEIYRGINTEYKDPRKYIDIKKKLDSMFKNIKNFNELKHYDPKDFALWITLKQTKRLGFFGTNLENIVKHAGINGTLLAVNIPDSKLYKYIPESDPGINAILKYGEIFFLPDDAPYNPQIFNLKEYPKFTERYLK